MKIALIGYGKMGKEIEQILISRGHTVTLIIDIDNAGDLNAENLRKADVAIEFTTPHTAFQNIVTCLEAGVPVVCGTTGWLDRYAEVEKLCNELLSAGDAERTVAPAENKEPREMGRLDQGSKTRRSNPTVPAGICSP